MDDALASPPPTWPAAVYSLLSNTSTEELPDLLLCEQSVSSYLYFELALSLSVVAQFSVWLYYGLIQYLKHGTLLEEGVLQLERGFIITLLLKGVSLVYGSVKVWTAKVCPTSNPLFYRLASCILISRYAEIAAVALWLPIDCARRRRDEALWRAQAQPQQKRRSVDGANAVNELTRVFLYRPRAGAAASDDPEEAPPKDATDASQLGGADPSGSAFIIAVEDGGETATAHPPHTILNLVAAGDGYTAADVEAACPPVEPTVTASRSPSLASQAGSVSFVGPLCFDTPSYSIVQCSICLCPFAKEDRIREIIQCKHSFHKECLELWWTRSWWGFRHCPVCRQSQ
ncbi:hypothetical protein DFJ73DRAFT_766144 [Zopfochytrium polystomum]|nr:hypothetical protein DFJ73DRAFT_766144 [Zopfochytrium polystomum]